MVSKKVSVFAKNRMVEFFGLGFILLGIFSMFSFLSFNPQDPSANYITTTDKIYNWGGIAGAYISGPALSFIGIGVVVLVLVPFIWGLKLLTKQEFSSIWLKITAFLLAMPAFAALFATLDGAIDTPELLPSESYGGYMGQFLMEELTPIITLPGFATAALLLTIITFIFAAGLTMAELAAIGRVIYFLFYYLTLPLVHIKDKFIELMEGEKAPKPVKRKPSIRKIGNEPKKEEKAKKPVQATLDLNMKDNYQIPPVNLLKTPPKKTKNTFNETSLSQNAELLEKVLDDFGVKGKIVEIFPGPVVTLYVLDPSPGTRSSRVIGLSDDIARSMSATSARIAVIPGRNAIGIELPNSTRETVYFRELLETDEFRESKAMLPLALGKDIGGNAIVIDMAKTPHLLVAGTTGSGKSVGLNGMILSLLYKYSPAECKFIMIDPKMLELSVYEDIPHLLTPVVTEPGKAIVALKWTVKEMENRYRLMSNLAVRNVQNYNEKIEEAKKNGEELTRTVQTGFDATTGKPIYEKVPLDMNPLPFIVVIVDEMADLMLVAGKDIETSVQRLAQMARAAGIHIILATQRPSVDVITGVIKANFPTRISFQVTSKIDSRTILGEQGAEQLLGMGDMLYMAGGSRITRVHGPFVDDKEVEKVVSFVKKQGKPVYIEDVTKDEEEAALFAAEGGAEDEMYQQAIRIVRENGKASTSFVQRSLRIGYNKAANLIERMEKEGIVSKADHVGRREVLV